MIRFSIEAMPERKERPGFGNGRAFTRPATRKYEKLVAKTATDWMRRHGLRAYDEAVVVTLSFRLLPQKSLSGKKRRALLAGELPPLIGLSDLDNLVKAVTDGLNKVAFRDDRLIVELHVRKQAAETVGTDILIETWDEARPRRQWWQECVAGGREDAARSEGPKISLYGMPESQWP